MILCNFSGLKERAFSLSKIYSLISRVFGEVVRNTIFSESFRDKNLLKVSGGKIKECVTVKGFQDVSDVEILAFGIIEGRVKNLLAADDKNIGNFKIGRAHV